MSKDSSNGFSNKGMSSPEEQESNTSFVRKVKSRVSGLLPSSLSKWFGSDGVKKAVVRMREEDEDDEQIHQPPVKRVKLPSSSSPVHDYNSLGIACSGFLPPGPSPSLFIRDDNIPGPSRETNDFYNGEDKDSESGESTSGYSSITKVNPPSETKKKDPYDITNVINANQLFSSPNFGHNRSLFADRSISSQANTSLSSRRPSFNASTFGSPSFVDRTLSTQRIMNSPFYNGCTMYGGASAHSKPKMPKIQIKPINETAQNVKSSSSTLSKTARRILDTLEQYATDVNRIPHPLSDKKARYSGSNPYVIREHRVLNTELQVPTVPELLRMKHKERLQDSTVTMRRIAAMSRTAQNEYKSSKHSNKIKNKVSSIRQKAEDEVVPGPTLNLPEIPLPITTLPKFDLSFPLSSTKPVTVACSEPIDPPKPKPPEIIKPIETKTSSIILPKTTMSIETKPVANLPSQPTETVLKFIPPPQELLEFKFADPLVLAENLKSIIAINDFIFSEPVIFNKLKSCDGFNIKLVNNTTTKPNTGTFDLAKFKPSSDTWECSVCLLRNLSDKVKCVACEAPKRTEDSKSKPSSFGSEFKLSDSKWECTSCMVRNCNKDSVCVACTTPKQKLNGPINNTFFDGKFKPPSGTWECPTCMIRNKDELDNCVACETAKVGSKAVVKPIQNSLDAFKMKSNQWECSICMVQNSLEKTKCAACETTKSNSQPENKTASLFTFGKFPATKTPTAVAGFKFVPPEDNFLNKTPQFSFGMTQTEAPVTSSSSKPNFTFGKTGIVAAPAKPIVLKTNIDPVEQQSESVPPLLFKTSTIASDSQNKSESTPSLPTISPGNKFFVSSQTAFTPPPPKLGVLPSTSTSENALSIFTRISTTPPKTTIESINITAQQPKSLFSMPSSTEIPQTFTSSKPVFQVAAPPQPTFESPTSLFSFGGGGGNLSFGQNPAESEKSAAPAFSFGAPVAGAFGLPTSAPAPAFNFNVPKMQESAFQVNAPPAVGNIFGGDQVRLPPQTVAPLQNGVFNFGGTTAPAKSGFNFGETTQPASNPAPPVFSFGSSQPALTTTSGGFNFNATATPAFNTDNKPTFNFTGGTTTEFTAQPSTTTIDGQAVPQRRKIQAIRRNRQR